MSITAEEIKREKKRLPRGWGRFGKTLDRLAAISQPDESLLSSCGGLNPASFKHKTRTLPGGLYEMTKTTNIVLASTSARLILIGTGFGGAHETIIRSPTTAWRWSLTPRRSSSCAGPRGRCESAGPLSGSF